MKKPFIAASAMLLSVVGFAGVANAYPVPSPPTTELAVQPPAPTTIPRPLPQTGSDVSESLLMGAAVVALGGGLVLVTRRRRHAET